MADSFKKKSDDPPEARTRRFWAFGSPRKLTFLPQFPDSAQESTSLVDAERLQPQSPDEGVEPQRAQGSQPEEQPNRESVQPQRAEGSQPEEQPNRESVESQASANVAESSEAKATGKTRRFFNYLTNRKSSPLAQRKSLTWRERFAKGCDNIKEKFPFLKKFGSAHGAADSDEPSTSQKEVDEGRFANWLSPTESVSSEPTILSNLPNLEVDSPKKSGNGSGKNGSGNNEKGKNESDNSGSNNNGSGNNGNGKNGRGEPSGSDGQTK